MRRNFRRAGRLKKSCRTSTLVPGALPAALTSAIFPPLTMICVPSGEWLSRSRVVRVKRLTLAMLGSASPRKPIVAIAARSSARWILLVAWRSRQSSASSRLMPGAVVGHADETASAGLDFDGDFFGAGIERIFDEFLHDAGGAFDHFAGGDLVGDLFGKQADAVHRPCSVKRESGFVKRERMGAQLLRRRDLLAQGFGTEGNKPGNLRRRLSLKSWNADPFNFKIASRNWLANSLRSAVTAVTGAN